MLGTLPASCLVFEGAPTFARSRGGVRGAQYGTGEEAVLSNGKRRLKPIKGPYRSARFGRHAGSRIIRIKARRRARLRERLHSMHIYLKVRQWKHWQAS